MPLLQASKESVLRIARQNIHPFSLKNLSQANAQTLLFQSELPIRYVKLLKMVTAPYLLDPKTQTKLEPISSRILSDIDLLIGKVDFTNQLRRVRNNHNELMKTFSEIVHQHQLVSQFPIGFLELFYVLNMSSRLLMDEHLSLVDKGSNLVQLIDPVQVAIEAAQKARYIAEKYSIDPPNIHVVNLAGDKLSTLYIREHLYYILVELLKNSIASIAQCQGKKPELSVMIASGIEDVTIHLVDEAGGMPLKQTDQLWNLKMISKPPFARGLPLCRIMARYFGGELEVIPMDGRGTNAYLHLFKQDSLEHIPELSAVNKPVIDLKSKSVVTDFIDEENKDAWLVQLLNK
jgi:pyruvate dehydrogenase kinase 2/3/4